MIRDSADVVAVLGGHKEMSNALRVHWRTVYNWTRPQRRIPADMRHHVAAVPRAQRAGITVAVSTRGALILSDGGAAARGATSRRSQASVLHVIVVLSNAMLSPDCHFPIIDIRI
jgi:hypothetical protein